MRRTLEMLIPVAVVVLLMAGCADDGGGTAAGAGTTTTAPEAATGGGGAGGGRAGYGDAGGGGGGDAARGEVRIADFAFAPDSLRAQVGQRVTWENRDTGVTHTVTADGGAFSSGDLASGKRFSFVFGTAGSFAYHCAIHRDMRGTVSVGP
ncbi:MAG TPA: cupredoxin family copper-binding protein [Actinomycetota bacterium]|nr:cupredoxin family copper-binding protein [Actinomycetota bacterium]